MPPWLQRVAGGCQVRLKVVPGASRPGVVGTLGDRLKLRVAEPPEGGRANRAVEDLLVRLTGRSCTVVAGQGTPLKIVLVAGADAATVAAALGPSPA